MAVEGKRGVPWGHNIVALPLLLCGVASCSALGWDGKPDCETNRHAQPSCKGNELAYCGPDAGDGYRVHWKDCADDGAVCRDGACVLPQGRCESDADSTCIGNLVHECTRGRRIVSKGLECASSNGMSCFETTADGRAVAFCAESLEPCPDDAGLPSCEGSTLVLCNEHGYVMSKRECSEASLPCLQWDTGMGIGVGCTDPECTGFTGRLWNTGKKCEGGEIVVCENGARKDDRCPEGFTCVTRDDAAMCADLTD